MTYRSILLALALILVLAACGQPPAGSGSEPAPTTVETAAPTTASAPTVANAPALPAAVLPAPLLFIDGEGQLSRLEADGNASVTLSAESAPIMDVAVAPDGSVIALLLISDDQLTTLVRMNADGSDRRELATGVLRGLTVASDGSVQAGVLSADTDAAATALRPGTWSFPADGGAPQLLVAATEPTTTDGQTSSGVYYQPQAWSPAGDQLLLVLTLNMGPDGASGDIGSTGLALYNPADGQTRELLALGTEPLCVVPVWSLAGDAVLCANGGAIGPPTPPLWRLSLTGAELQTLVPAGEPIDQVFSPRALPDGIYYLAGESTVDPLRLMPQRLRADGTVDALLPQPVEAGYDGGLWAPDGSGVIVGQPAAGANRTILWYAFSESAPVELLNGSIGELEWARQPN